MAIGHEPMHPHGWSVNPRAAWAFATAGWRGADFAARALPASLEGLDLPVTGIVVAMPQRNDGGLRFRLRVESAGTVDGASVAGVPSLIELHWYRGPMTFET